ncbi:MAG: sugar transferase [Ruminococcus sp.]|nr:sugar transferase [Candidatus Apopatosoma intestinale]
MKYSPFWKRTFDLILSILLLIVLSPLLIAVAVILLFTSDAPVLFTQMRVGKGKRPFCIYKFRTMKAGAPEAPSRTVPEEYVSRFGAFLRRTGMDELPQLLNIIRGDMSLIGPRPLILDETEMHERREALGVYRVAPGLTGLAQVHCEDITSLSEKAEYDARYVDHITFFGDIRILFATVGKMIAHKGIREHLT